MPLVKSHYGAIPQPVPAVSVVVPIYNGEEDLPDLVDCLLAQTYPAERLEYWLVDNGSREGTLSQHHTLAHPFLPYGQTANLAVRAEIFRQVGLFRPQLTTGGDADLCWRIQQATPWSLVAAPDAVVYHRHRQNLPDLWRQ